MGNAMYRKLFVVTAGTIAAGVGQEILRQMNARPDSDLKVMVRCIDTARLINRYSMRDGEWFQMTVDPVHMRALYNSRSNHPRLNRILYPALLPKPTGVGGGSIRYNGSGAVLVNRDNLKKWFSANMTALTHLGDNQTNFSVALIVSAVGATGSGSLEYLSDTIAEAAQESDVPIPIRMDTFILQPGMEGVSQLGQANTLALYAELASSRLAQNDMSDKQYQGRIVMVGWGSNRRLASIEQLEETTATLVRLINDPTSDIVAEYQEREVDNHVLLHIDELTELPTNLSSATPVTIGLGRLEEQIIQRDAALLINNLVFGAEGSNANATNGNALFIGTLATAMAGDTAEERYSNLLQFLAAGESGGLRSLRRNFRDQALGYLPQEMASKLEGTWLNDKTQIAQQAGAMRTVGNQLINEVAANWLRLRRDGMATDSSLSLSSLRGHYQRLYQILNETLKFAREMTRVIPDDNRVAARLKEVEAAARARGRRGEQERQTAVEGAVREIQRNMRDQLSRQANPAAIDVLEELAYRSSEALVSLEAVLQRLERQRQTMDSWNIATRELNFGIAHPLELPALADRRAVDEYYRRVSIFTARTRGRDRATTEMDQIAGFRHWLADQQNMDDLFKGDIDLLLRVAQQYTRDKVHEEVEKYSVLDVLLQGGEESLPQRLADAAELAHPLISFNSGFAPDRQEVWHVCAYVKDKDQRDELQKAVNRVFPQGRCSLLETKDPTEIVVFYYVDGIPASAINDLTGRCLEAFLKLRRNWYKHARSNGNGSANNPGQRVSIPIYSGREADKRVIEQGIICKLCKVTGRFIEEYHDLPELQHCSLSSSGDGYEDGEEVEFADDKA